MGIVFRNATERVRAIRRCSPNLARVARAFRERGVSRLLIRTLPRLHPLQTGPSPDLDNRCEIPGMNSAATARSHLRTVPNPHAAALLLVVPALKNVDDNACFRRRCRALTCYVFIMRGWPEGPSHQLKTGVLASAAVVSPACSRSCMLSFPCSLAGLVQVRTWKRPQGRRVGDLQAPMASLHRREPGGAAASIDRVPQAAGRLLKNRAKGQGAASTNSFLGIACRRFCTDCSRYSGRWQNTRLQDSRQFLVKAQLHGASPSKPDTALSRAS
jgi:hypothetical protein